MKRKCAVFHGAGKDFTIEEFEVTPAMTGYAGLKLISSGICGTDVHIHEGRLGMPEMPLILGHEFIGEIDSLGSEKACDALGNPLRIGDRAIACVAIPCGKCFNCAAGETASCLNFGVTYVKNVEDPPHFHGGFAEYLYSPIANLVKLPDGIDPFAAAAFPCGGPTIIRACTYGGGLHQGELAVIQGNGSLGLFAAAYAKAAGCHVMIVGSGANPLRSELTQAMKPDRFFDFRKDSPEAIREAVLEYARELGRGDGADIVIETSGGAGAFPFGLTLLRTRGRYFVPGQYSDRGEVGIPPHLITFRALQIFGSGQYTMADLGVYVKFLAEHTELQPVFRRIVSTFSVAEVNDAIKAAADGKTIKAAFCMK